MRKVRVLTLLLLVPLLSLSSLFVFFKIQNEYRDVQKLEQQTKRRLTEESAAEEESAAAAASTSAATAASTSTAPPLLPPILNHHQCKENAIVYLTQKRHSSYGRDSYSLFQKSLELLYKNYLSNFHENAAVFIFHEGDFDQHDLEFLDSKLPVHGHGLHLVNLTGTKYWQVPQWLQQDDTSTWHGIQHYSVGYRHMMRWYAIQIWDFFHDLNQQHGCQYKYVMRLDEESYLHSPIEYDLFRSMKEHDYIYGFRQCSYELSPVQRAFKQFRKETGNQIPIHRDFRKHQMCGFYNNFFIASIDFMRSARVQQFLRWVDQQGIIYRERVNDLVLQTAVVYAFSPPGKIHRFLDFTYEHFTVMKNGCPLWGGIQAGYADPNGAKIVQQWAQQNIMPHCHLYSPDHKLGVRINQVMDEADLSPTYQHLPPHLQGNLKLLQVAAGAVDLPDHGINSG